MSEELEEKNLFDETKLEEMNRKAIQNQFFTPDNIYLELGLFKDFSLGALYFELLVQQKDEQKFNEVQKKVLPLIPEYQNRVYDTVEPYFDNIGYKDSDIDRILENSDYHDHIFLISPSTKFIQTIIKHMYRNQNHSAPANKYSKRYIDSSHYTLEATDVSCRINTYPLTLSETTMKSLGEELGEALGVNIAFMNKNPSLFDAEDWQSWMKNTECFYLDIPGRFTQSVCVMEKQHDMEFSGRWIFSRKRFEKEFMEMMKYEDFDHQVHLYTSRLSIFCDFEWLKSSDICLVEEPEDVSMNDDQVDPDPTPQGGNES